MSEKNGCTKCKKLFTIRTLQKRNGVCGRCAKSQGRMSDGKKLSIPKKLKERCWRMYVGDKLDGKCYSCEEHIKFSGFHTGHVLSEYDGGTINIKNLRPICAPCNLSSGVMNLDEFKKTLTPNESKALPETTEKLENIFPAVKNRYHKTLNCRIECLNESSRLLYKGYNLHLLENDTSFKDKRVINIQKFMDEIIKDYSSPTNESSAEKYYNYTCFNNHMARMHEYIKEYEDERNKMSTPENYLQITLDPTPVISRTAFLSNLKKCKNIELSFNIFRDAPI